MIRNIPRFALFAEINAATQRLTEVPFNLSTQEGNIYGMIDLLYQDNGGTWHLIDWKTEWAPRDHLEQHIQGYAQQVELFAIAMGKY